MRRCADPAEVGSPAEWARLRARPPASLIGSRLWLEAAFATTHRRFEPCLLAVDIGGRLAGLLPLALAPAPSHLGVRLAGAPYNDLSDLLAVPGHEEDVAAALLGELAAASAAGYSIELKNLDPEGALATADRELGVLTWEEEVVAPTIDLDGGWRTVASGRRRRKWRNRARRLDERYATEIRSVSGQAMEAGLHRFQELRELRRRQTGRPAERPPVRLIEEVVRRLAPAGHCLFMDFRVDAKPVARDLYLVDRPVAMLWLRGLDPAWHRFPCGHFLLRRSAELFEEHGYAALDLGRGDEAYKYVFGARRRVLMRAWRRAEPAAAEPVNRPRSARR